MKTGIEAFTDYYKDKLGEALFSKIKSGLTTDTLPILRFKHGDKDQLKKLWSEQNLEWQTLSWYPYALYWPKDIPLRTALPGFYERMIFAMNASSLIPVLAMGIRFNDKILDACAAPGGKAMFIADELNGKGELITNDLSPFRRSRMQQLFTAYRLTKIRVLAEDSRELSRNYPNYFDKVLLDAPCSSEKHIYADPKAIAKWSYSRILDNKKRQLQLINGLLKTLKPGGILIYSTCAITPEEDEEVISDVLEEYSDLTLQVPPSYLPSGKAFTVKGISPDNQNKLIRILPGNNLDPMFVAVLKKNKSSL